MQLQPSERAAVKIAPIRDTAQKIPGGPFIVQGFEERVVQIFAGLIAVDGWRRTRIFSVGLVINPFANIILSRRVGPISIVDRGHENNLRRSYKVPCMSLYQGCGLFCGSLASSSGDRVLSILLNVVWINETNLYNKCSKLVN